MWIYIHSPTETALPVSKFPHTCWLCQGWLFGHDPVHCATLKKLRTFNKYIYPLYWIHIDWELSPKCKQIWLIFTIGQNKHMPVHKMWRGYSTSQLAQWMTACQDLNFEDVLRIYRSKKLILKDKQVECLCEI
jgi:hypothetical protein